MSTRITLCRDILEPTYDDCIEDHEGAEPLVAPCKVDKVEGNTCGLAVAAETVSAEAESSATRQDEMVIRDCCDC